MGSGIYNGNMQRKSFGSNQIEKKYLAHLIQQPIPKKIMFFFDQLKQPLQLLFINKNLIG